MSEISQLAKDWIDRVAAGDGVTGTWRLEILQKRLAANKDGTPKDGKEIPVRIRRFLKGIPWAQVHDAIRYLISKSPYDDIIYNGLKIEGKYRPTLTQWRRDDQEQVGGNAQGSYTLIQDLIEVTEEGDDFEGTTAESCSEIEETRWVWDAPEIEELPYSSEQGVSYAIRQVRRNDDGTFDYAAVKRIAKTQVSDETVASCDEYETVYVRVFDNVYGGEGGEPFRDDAGNPVAVPQPCEDRETGELIQVQKSQNPDCTFKVTVQRTESKQAVQSTETSKSLRGGQKTTVTRNRGTKVSEANLEVGDRVRNELQPDGRYTTTEVRASKVGAGPVGHECSTTVFEHAHTDITNVASKPGKEASGAGDGKTYRKTIRATDEGTFDVSEETTVELNPGIARHSMRKTPRGVVETQVYRNVTDDSVKVTDVGEEVVVERTPGGRFNRTVTKVPEKPTVDVASQCQNTVFEHQDVKTTSSASASVGSHAQAAGDGKTYEKDVRLTDEGTYDVTERTTTERSVSNAVVSARRTIRGVTESVTHRNVTDGRVDVKNVGDESRVEMTPGGLYNRTDTVVVAEPAGQIGSSCGKSQLKHSDSVTKNVLDGQQPQEHRSSEVNMDQAIEVRMTDEGSWDVTESTTVYEPDVKSYTAGSVSETVEIEIGRNAEDVESSPGGQNVEVALSASENDHGSVDYQRRTTTFIPDDRTVGPFENSNRSESVRFVRNVPDAPTESGGEGKLVDVSLQRNGHGSYDGRISVVTAKPQDTGWVTWTSKDVMPTYTYEWTHGIRVFTNQRLSDLGSLKPPDGTSGSMSVSINSFGLLDGTSSYRKLDRWARSETGGGGDGGSIAGNKTIYKWVSDGVDSSGQPKFKRMSLSIDTRSYFGRGNEGSEADARARGPELAGLKLPDRTYVTAINGDWH